MKEPIRVLHSIASLHFGGAQAFVMNIYNKIDRSKIQFDFVVKPEEHKDLYTQVEQMGGRIFVCPQYTGKNHIVFCRWWNNFFSLHPEYHIIHCHVRSTAAICLRIAGQHGLITIAHSHSTSNGNGLSGIVKSVMQLPIRYTADYFFSCSDEAGVWLYGKKVIKKNNYYMIPNGIDLNRFAFDSNKRDQMRKYLGIESGEFVLGHVGRFSTPKNHKFLVKIFSEYHKRNPKSRLLMVGDGELFEAVKQQCIDAGIIHSVIMPGNRINTEDYYQVMDAFLFPSLWEGFPVAVLEAQASGLQCLISDVITHEVNLTDLVTYLPLENKNMWASALEKMEGEKRIEISAYNRQMLFPFDCQRIAEKLEIFYLEQDRIVNR